MRNITKRQAEATLRRLRKQFAGYNTESMKLYEPGYHTRGWSIAWEEGPYEWAILAIHGGYGEHGRIPAVEAPKQVFVEPQNHWLLGLWPDA